MNPAKRKERLDKWREEYNAALHEEKELLAKQSTAFSMARSKAEYDAVKALYKDILSPVRKRKNTASAAIKRLSMTEAQESEKSCNTISYRMFGKTYSELNYFERKQYNAYMRKRSYLLRKASRER